MAIFIYANKSRLHTACTARKLKSAPAGNNEIPRSTCKMLLVEVQIFRLEFEWKYFYGLCVAMTLNHSIFYGIILRRELILD